MYYSKYSKIIENLFEIPNSFGDERVIQFQSSLEKKLQWDEVNVS